MPRKQPEPIRATLLYANRAGHSRNGNPTWDLVTLEGLATKPGDVRSPRLKSWEWGDRLTFAIFRVPPWLREGDRDGLRAANWVTVDAATYSRVEADWDRWTVRHPDMPIPPAVRTVGAPLAAVA